MDTIRVTRTVGQNNIIELNGKRYDAVTGAFLGSAQEKPRIPGMPTSQRGRVIDGFIRKPQAEITTHAAKPSTPKTVAAPAKVSAPKTKAAIQHHPKQMKAHQPERPKTLMRRAVHKPKVDIKPNLKLQTPAELMAKPKSDIAKTLEKKLSVTQVNPIRLARAKHVAKSQHVRHFAKHTAKERAAAQVTPAVAVVVAPVKPVQASHVVSAPAPTAFRQTRPHIAGQYPQRATMQGVASRPHRAASAPVHAPVKHVKQSQDDIFEAAIAHAKSHEQVHHQPKRRSNKWLNLAAGFGGLLLIASFIAYLNMNTIELRVASVRAGFHAEMPGYQPTGYALGPVTADKGKVSLSFVSGDSKYQINQEVSDWDSQTLLDNFVASTSNHEVVESKGRTIYVYNGNNATWVNGGIKYDITGDASLSSEELVALATSI